MKDDEKAFTYEQYAAMPEDGNRYEIIDGALETMPRVGSCSSNFRSYDHKGR